MWQAKPLPKWTELPDRDFDFGKLVDGKGLEPLTFRTSSERSSQLS